MLYSYNLLQSFIKQKLVSADQLNDMLNNCLGDTHYKKINNDYVFDVELTANRVGVLASHNNLAKEISAMFDLDLKESSKFKIKHIANPAVMSVKNSAKASCQAYYGIVLNNIKIKESPQFIKDALNNCGLRAINNVVDITNYVMLETGQPMHAFDYDKIEGNKINVRYAKNDETITVLTGDKYKLTEDVLVIADQKKPMAIAGIKGGVTGEIDKNTKMIVLESANFNSSDIYKTSKFLNLATDASVRFSHKLSPSIAKEALKRAVELFEKYANAKVVSNVLETNEINDKPLTIPFNLERVAKLIGQVIDEKDIKRILTKLGYTIKPISKTLWNVGVPLYRNNVLIFEDIADDLVRIYGLDNLDLIPPKVELKPPKDNEFYQFKEMIKNIMVSLGLDEVYNYSFIHEFDTQFLNDQQKSWLVGPKNYLSENYQYLNPVASISLLKNVATNLSYFEKAKFFQIDKNYRSVGDVIFENTYLSLAIYDLNKKQKETDKLLEAKGIIETLFNKLSIDNSKYYFSDKYLKESDKNDTIFKNVIYIYNLDNELIGSLGSVSDRVKTEYKIRNEQKNPQVVLLEIDLSILYKLVIWSIDFKPIPKYPSSIRDISLIVPQKLLVNDVMVEIHLLKIEDLKDIDIFDVYESLADNKKSVSFHLMFRNDEKTLSSSEVDKYLELIKNHLQNKGYIIR